MLDTNEEPVGNHNNIYHVILNGHTSSQCLWLASVSGTGDPDCDWGRGH